jgi:hypothetical protein
LNADLLSRISLMRVRLLLGAMVFGVACTWPAAGAAQVLYRTPSLISRLTATSGRLAWAEQRPGAACFRLYRRRVFGTTPTRVTRCRLNSRPIGRGSRTWVRLFGTHVFWSETGLGNTEVDEWVYSTLPNGRRDPTVYTINCGGSSGGGKLLGPIAVGALSYSVFSVITDGACGPLSGPGAALIAQAGRDLLEVPAVINSNGVQPGTTLELRGDRSGSLRWSTAFTGTARAVALSQRYTATLVRPATGAPRIRAYATGSGKLVRALPLRATVLPMAAVSGPRVIFAYPRWIMVWNVRRNLLRRLRRTPRAARNLAADGRLVVWSTPHTIRAVLLPRAAP